MTLFSGGRRHRHYSLKPLVVRDSSTSRRLPKAADPGEAARPLSHWSSEVTFFVSVVCSDALSRTFVVLALSTLTMYVT
jgi:hypothetical protein